MIIEKGRTRLQVPRKTAAVHSCTLLVETGQEIHSMKQGKSNRRWLIFVLIGVVVASLWCGRVLMSQRHRRMILVSWQRRGILLELDANGPELLRRWVPSLGRIVGATSPKLIGLTDPKGLMEDSDFEILPSFGEIQKVFLYGAKITDSGLQSICRNLWLK